MTNDELRELAERWLGESPSRHDDYHATACSTRHDCARAILSLIDAEGDGGAMPFAYGSEDGRVIPKATRDTALRDGGASKSATDIYTIPLYTHPAQPAAMQAQWPSGSVDVMADAYVAAVNEFLGNMSESEWIADRLDKHAHLAKVARVGIRAALQAFAPPKVGAVPAAWQRRICHEDGRWMAWEYLHDTDSFPEKIGRWKAEYRPLFAAPQPPKVQAGAVPDYEPKLWGWWAFTTPGGVVRQLNCPAEWEGRATPLYTHHKPNAVPQPQASAVPDGWALKPREPTNEMCSAPDSVWHPEARKIWQQMFDVAPQPKVQP